jgi:hypothetical protein
MKTTLISRIYRTLQAKEDCRKIDNIEWFNKHSYHVEELAKNYLPSGSGINAGCEISQEESNENKIVITFSYDHMNENGYYEGCTYHKCICKPTFDGPELKITGKNKNGIKEYLYDIFSNCLNEEIEFLPYN